jgi:hypothetical protein
VTTRNVSGVNKDGTHKDKEKDWIHYDQDKDLTHKDKDKDKDLYRRDLQGLAL